MKKILFNRMNRKKTIVKCHKCGKTLEVPNMMRQEVREGVLSPFCCAYTVFLVQWLIHHGWHIRNFGLTDSHPYFCSDCWEKGIPEYDGTAYGKQWCEQALKWLEQDDPLLKIK